MNNFPKTSFHIKNEQCRLSLIEYEEDIAGGETTTLTGESVQSENKHGEKVQLQSAGIKDIIAKALIPTFYKPPAKYPPLEPWRPFNTVYDLLKSTLLTLLFYTSLPVLSSLYILLGLFPRLLVQFVLRLGNGGKLQLMPISRVYGSANDNVHSVMLICRGRCDIDKIRAHMNGMINAKDPITDKRKFANLQNRVTIKFGYLCLENCATTFNIKNHVKYFDIRTKHIPVSFHTITSYLESSYNYPFENQHTAPQWELLVVPKFEMTNKAEEEPFSSENNDMHYALILRFHNGVLNWNMLQELLIECIGKSYGNVKSIFCPKKAKDIGFWRRLQQKLACPFVGPQAFLRNILKSWESFAGMKPLNADGKISFASTRPISAETIEEINHRTNTGAASVLGSCVRMSVRNMALGQNMDFPKSLCAARVFNSMNTQLPGVDMFSATFQKYRGSMQRFYATYFAVEKKEACLSGQRAFNRAIIFLAGTFPCSLSAWLYKTLLKADVVVEICPSTDEPCKLFRDDLLEDIYGWSGITGIDSNFKITITSYCGRIRANVIGKLGELSGGLTDAQVIANEFEVEYQHIASAIGLYPQKLYVMPQIAE